MLPEFKLYYSIQFGIFLTFATIKVVGEPKQQNLLSAKKFVKSTGCFQLSNSLNMTLNPALALVTLFYCLFVCLFV